MPGSYATTAIITNGLGGAPACKGLITTHFSLVCDLGGTPPEPEPEPIVGGGGGPYPGPAWNKFDSANDIYTPVEEQPYIVPRDKEADFFRKHKIITMRVSIRNINIEKIYRVPEERANILINSLDVINTTKDNIFVFVNDIKRKTHDITIGFVKGKLHNSSVNVNIDKIKRMMPVVGITTMKKKLHNIVVSITNLYRH